MLTIEETSSATTPNTQPAPQTQLNPLVPILIHHPITNPDPSPDQPPTPCPKTPPHRKLPAWKPMKSILKPSPQPQPKFNFKRALVGAGGSCVGQVVWLLQGVQSDHPPASMVGQLGASNCFKMNAVKHSGLLKSYLLSIDFGLKLLVLLGCSLEDHCLKPILHGLLVRGTLTLISFVL
ncbi:hypothetical protein VP01_2727g3 [Puccinia sorghi]|uniref:Uncharacterized protein n=1 Tax=Puccinia sorghi TaxID=27349 RepID=A0A0L6V3D2_9BASI|nr:hypothetical protein VP01_2727g3 [Puccinia sorghi]